MIVLLSQATHIRDVHCRSDLRDQLAVRFERILPRCLGANQAAGMRPGRGEVSQDSSK